MSKNKKVDSDEITIKVNTSDSIEIPVKEEKKDVEVKEDIATVIPKKENNPELKSPKDWAIITGNGPSKSKNVWNTGQKSGGKPAGMSRVMGSMAHEVASQLHGWKKHEYHTGSPILLTKEIYLKALSTAMCSEGNPEPYAPALSPHKDRG